MGAESFLLQTSRLGTVILRVARGGGRWWGPPDLAAVLPEWDVVLGAVIQQVGLGSRKGSTRVVGWGVSGVFVLERCLGLKSGEDGRRVNSGSSLLDRRLNLGIGS